MINNQKLSIIRNILEIYYLLYYLLYIIYYFQE